MSLCRMIDYHFLPQPARCLGPARDAADVRVMQAGFASIAFLRSFIRAQLHCTPLSKHVSHAGGRKVIC
jgi:hypothetical protein